MVVIRISASVAHRLHAGRVWVSRLCALAMMVSAFAFSLPTPIPSTPVVRAGVYIGRATTTAEHVKPVRRVSRIRPTTSVMCLAQTLYFEAAHEPYEGIVAVAATVFNRMSLRGQYPSSVCGVVYQPFQYSWTADAANWSRTPPREFITLATQMLSDRAIIRAEYPVTHFHRVDIAPAWSRTLTHVVTLGQHKFYGL